MIGIKVIRNKDSIKIFGNPNLKLEEKFTQEYWGYSTMSVSLQSKNTDKSKPTYYAKLFAYDLNEQKER